MMLALTSVNIPDEKRRGWVENVTKSWDRYLARLYGVEEIPEDVTDVKMKEFYDKVISKMKPVLSRDSNSGKLVISDLEGKLPKKVTKPVRMKPSPPKL